MIRLIACVSAANGSVHKCSIDEIKYRCRIILSVFFNWNGKNESLILIGKEQNQCYFVSLTCVRLMKLNRMLATVNVQKGKTKNVFISFKIWWHESKKSSHDITVSCRIPSEIPHFNGKKSCKWVIGLHRQSAPTWSDKKKADPMTNFVPNFSDDPRCAPIKSYGQALVPIVPFSIWESASLCGVMRVFRNVNRIYPGSYGRVTLVSRRLYNDIATRSNPSWRQLFFNPTFFSERPWSLSTSSRPSSLTTGD